MNWLDGLIIVFLGISAFIGSRRGLIKTFFPLAVIVLAIFVAGYYYLSAANYSGSWMSSPNQAQIATFIIIFILVIVAALLFFWLLRKLLDLLLKGKAEMTNSVIPLMGMLIGIALAGLFYGSVADWLSTWLASPSQAALAAFVIIFILATAVTTKLLLSLASLMEKAQAHYSSLVNQFNGLGGTILGLAIGGLLSGALLTIVANFYYTSVETTMRNSSLASFLLNNFPFVLRILPKEFDIVRQLFS
jgi:membrane protein required for colicin V production